jgi:predicted O-methyltransferase YrrM
LLFGPKRYKYLYYYIEKLKAKNIMEIGTWNGNRAKKMIEIAMKHHQPREIFYFGFDLFEEMTNELYQKEISKIPPSKQTVYDALHTTGANIQLFKGYTADTLPRSIKDLPKMDFVFIDGGHALETIRNDWKYTQQVMGEDTVVIFDDYWNDRMDGGAKPIVDAIDQQLFNVTILPRLDSFNNPDHGVLNIQFAKITRKIK